MEIVNFSPDFLNDIIAIENGSFPRPWNEKMFLDSAANKGVEFKVAVENKKTAGYCLFWIAGGETEILNIAVAEEFRGRSFARNMLALVEKMSKEAGSGAIFLEVRENNKAAINLYLSSGFEKTGIRKKYYITEDAV
ncbi:MAG: ribosomal protein S18-alanine N-acetyltransferase, partial [Endomicrobia bacterium]|nr:ribosomal protein S18-alanine N-acetyltransferase [Endomicrobiia bacterium]